MKIGEFHSDARVNGSDISGDLEIARIRLDAKPKASLRERKGKEKTFLNTDAYFSSIHIWGNAVREEGGKYPY